MPDKTNQQPQQAPSIQQPVQAPVATVQQATTSGLAVAGMVLGILAFLLSFIPLMNIGSIVMGLLGLVLAAVGLISTKGGKHRGKGLAIAGIVLSILAMVIVFAMYGTASSMSNNSSSPAAASSAQTETAAVQTSSSVEPAQQEEELAAEYEVTIGEARLGQDHEGNEIAIVGFTWTNNSDKSASFAGTLHAKAFQNNVEIDNIVFAEDVDESGYMSEVKPGGTVSFEWPYAISDHSDLTVEVKELISFDDTIIAEKTFSFE